MSLTELQLPEKKGFYSRLQSAATQMDNLITQWRNLAEFVDMIDSVDLDAMGVAAGQVRTDLTQFKTVLSEMINLYDGNSVAPTNTPSAVIDKIRHM